MYAGTQYKYGWTHSSSMKGGIQHNLPSYILNTDTSSGGAMLIYYYDWKEYEHTNYFI